jgi:MFS transporter, AAHS family, 4-hydroxybenzoate transporter
MSNTAAASALAELDSSLLDSAAPDEAGNIDLDRLLDTRRIAGGHVLITALGFAVLLIDGFDLVVTAQLLPAIAQDFAITTAKLTQALALQTLGQAVGAFMLSPLADRFGRKPMLLFCLLFFGLSTIASVSSTTLLQFNALRFFGGAFGGTLMPVTISLVADMSPRKWRSTFIGAAYAGLAVGPLLTAAVTAWVLVPYGWRSAYWIGGAAPLLLLPFILWLMPESPRYLARQNDKGKRIKRALHSIGVHVSPGDASFVTEMPIKGRSFPIVELFQHGRAWLTAMLWTVSLFAVSAYTLAQLNATFFHDFAAIPLARFAGVLALTHIGSITSMFTTGPIMDRVGPYRVVVVNAVLAGLAFWALAFIGFGTVPFMLIVFVGGFCGAGAQQGLNILSPILYPPPMRSSAVGAKGGVGKLAGAAAPLLAGVILARHAGLPIAMFSCAAAYFLVAALTPLLGIAASRYGTA